VTSFFPCEVSFQREVKAARSTEHRAAQAQFLNRYTFKMCNAITEITVASHAREKFPTKQRAHVPHKLTHLKVDI